MAGYKKQSKKSPLKKYATRNIRKLDVSEQKKTYASNAKAQGSVGRAVGAIGKEVGAAYDTLKGKSDAKKKAAADKKVADKKAQDAKLKKGADAANEKLKGLEHNLNPNPSKLPEIGKVKPKQIAPPPIVPPPPPTVVQPNTDIVGGTNWEPRSKWTGDSAVQDRPLTENDAWGTTGAAEGMQFPANNWGSNFGSVKPAGSWYNPQHPGSGNINPAKSPIQRNPGIQPEYMKSPFRRNPYGNSPLKRMSPLKAAADEISVGTQYVDQMQRSTAPSYLGEEGAAASEGYNQAIDQHNYDQRVWAEKGKDLDDAYGKLQVEPTGVNSWDSSAQIMAKEWKDEFTDLYNNKDQYSYEEYASKLADIKGRASSYQNANANIKQIVSQYQENKDNVSASTPSSSIDILETLAKGGDGLTVQNIDGVPTLAGTTLGGQDVSVPISEIASGKNLWRVNQQVDVSPQISTIADQLGKFRTQIAQNGGLTTAQVPFEQLRGRAESQIDGLLQNESTTSAIAADRFGLNYRQQQEMDADQIHEFVKGKLMGEIEAQFQPYTQVQTGRTVDPVARERRIAANQSGGGGSNTAGERDYAKSLAAANQALNKDFDYTSPDSFKNLGYSTFTMDQLSKDQQKTVKERYGEGAYVIKVGKKNVVVPPDASREWVARNIFGVDPGELTPLQRLSPFKRLTNWMGITK